MRWRPRVASLSRAPGGPIRGLPYEGVKADRSHIVGPRNVYWLMHRTGAASSTRWQASHTTPSPGSRDGVPTFPAFLEEHRRVVYRFLHAAVGPVEVDDCFQETFLAALKAYPKLRNGDNLRGWVLAIATRKAIDSGRARARRAVPVGEISEVADRAQGANHTAQESNDPPALDDPLWDAV